MPPLVDSAAELLNPGLQSSPGGSRWFHDTFSPVFQWGVALRIHPLDEGGAVPP